MNTTGAGVGDPVAATSAESAAAGGIATAQVASDRYRRVASLWHTLLVLVVQGVLSYRGAVRFGQVHDLVGGNRAGLYERTMVFQWVMLGVVLIGVWWHGSSLLTVLGERWRSVGHFLRDVGIAVLLLMGTIAIGSVFGHGGNAAAHAILPQERSEMWLWVALSVTAGICEEAI